MQTLYWKRMAGDALWILALALVANLTVGPGVFNPAERRLEWFLAAALILVAIPVSIAVRKLPHHHNTEAQF